MSELDCAGNPSQKWGISERFDFVTGVISMDLIKHLEKAVRILPRFMAVFPYERGVFLRMGKCKRTLEPGLYFCLPIIDEIQKLDVTPQVINLPNQSITTKDGKTLAVSGAIEYSISDPQKALLEVQNFDASLQNLSMGIIGQYIKQRTYEECIKLDGLEHQVIEGIRNRAIDWGLKVTKFWVTDLAQHHVYRLMTQDTPVKVVPREAPNYE
jgi:regulator of protease activity HflC (stomatin/prohibitin superfamily)